MCFDWSGGDWHEVVAAKRNLNPYGQRASVDNYHGGAGGSVRQTHTLAYVNMCSAVTLKFLKNDIFHHFFWNSEKLKSFFLVTPTCRGHSQSDGATGFWGDLPVLTYLHFSRLSYKTVWCSRQSRASLSPATLLPSAEMWSGFRSSRKELTFYLSAGTPWTRSCVTFILVSQIW